MRIQKEIENVERIENRQPVEPLTMEDAVIQHKKAVDKYEEERKEINKELDLDSDIEEKGFTGASKEPKKVSTPELKKMKLSEALFEYLDESLNEEFKISDKTIKLLMFELYDVYSGMDEVETFYRFCLNKLNMTVTDIVKYVGAFVKSDIDYIADFIINDTGYYDKEDNNYSDTNKVVKILRKYGIDAVAVRDYDDYDEEEFFDIEVKGLLNKNTNESLDEELEDTDGWGDEIEYIPEDYNDELDRIRAEERRKKQKAFNDLGKEHDWEKEFEKAKFEYEKAGGDPDDLDFTGWVKEMGYSDNEYNQIMQYIDNQQKEKEYEDKLKADEKAKKDAEEERKKAEQEKEEKTKKNLERIGKAANAPKDIGNALKKGLGNAGIHIG